MVSKHCGQAALLQSLSSWNNVYPALWLCWKLFNPNCLYSLQGSVHASQVTAEDAVMNVRKTSLAIPRCIAFVSIIKWDNWIRNCHDINAYLLYSQGRQGTYVEKQPFTCLCVWDGQVFILFIYIVVSMVKMEVRDEEESLLCAPPCSNSNAGLLLLSWNAPFSCINPTEKEELDVTCCSFFAACGCNLEGTRQPTCDKATGACNCRAGVTGRLCDQCGRGFQKDFPSCRQCHLCFDQWDTEIAALAQTVKGFMRFAAKLEDKGGRMPSCDTRFKAFEDAISETERILRHPVLSLEALSGIRDFQGYLQ